MRHATSEDAAELKRRAERLRECACEARALARRLGPYLDDAAKKAAPRAADFRTGNDANALWQGPFADECTARLQQRQRTLNGMGDALPADATRWEPYVHGRIQVNGEGQLIAEYDELVPGSSVEITGDVRRVTDVEYRTHVVMERVPEETKEETGAQAGE